MTAAVTRFPGRVWHGYRSLDLSGEIAGAMVILLILLAIFGPLLAPYDASSDDLLNPFATSSADHLLGTDASGRDLFSRLLIGTRTALLGPFVLVAITTVLGTTIAILAAWYRGRVDAVVARALDIMLAFPSLLIALVVIAVFGGGLTAAIGGLTLGYTAWNARVLRGAALRERSQPYIAACYLQGVSGFTICLRHLLPNIAPLVLAQAAAAFGYAMIDLAALSFLGVGVQPPTPDWGTMVGDGQSAIIQGHPAESLYAAAAIVIAVVSFNVLSDRINARLAEGGS